MEFRGAAYAHAYKQAEEAGLVEKRASPVEFKGTGYARAYKQAEEAGLAAEK